MIKTIREYGYVRVGAAVPEVRVADTVFNAGKMEKMMAEAAKNKVEILAFPELSVTGATCGDLFFQDALLKGALEALERLLAVSEQYPMVVVAGMPLKIEGRLYNAAVVLQRGLVLGVVLKRPDRDSRWFSRPEMLFGNVDLLGRQVAYGESILFQEEGREDLCFGVVVGDPLGNMMSAEKAVQAGAALILCLSAYPETWGRSDRVCEGISSFTERMSCGYVVCGAGMSESTTDAVYSGQALVCEMGETLAEAERFTLSNQLVFSDVDCQKISSIRTRAWTMDPVYPAENWERILFSPAVPSADTVRRYSKTPFVPKEELLDKRCAETFQMLAGALARRMRHTGLQKMIAGISGGLDSTLVLLIMLDACRILGWENEAILCLTMPGFGTTDHTYQNAVRVMRGFGVPYREISIREACLQHFIDIGHDPEVLDAAYENAQARERTQILMDVANQENGLVVGTGDLSELALGWCTYNGDHMSMYSINGSVAKTFIPHLIRYKAQQIQESALRDSLLSITETPISPELLPPDKSGAMKQKTEETVGPYLLHDFFLYHFMAGGATPEKILYLARQTFAGAFDEQEIQKWLKLFFRRFFSQQFKRSCAPEGPGIGQISLSPRGGLQMPGDAAARIWLKELEKGE